MKPTTALAVLSLTLLLVGCSPALRFTDQSTCEDENTITLSYGEGVLSVDRGCINADRGETVAMNLVPVDPMQTRRVSTKYLGLGNRWLDQVSETGQGMIMLPIPRDEDRETFKYIIKVKGVGKLDPRIVVQ